MTSDETFQEELARKENPGIRLVYADWLEERGQGEQAGFLRALHQLEEAHRTLAVLRPKLEPAWLTALGEPQQGYTMVRVNLDREEEEHTMCYLPNADIWPALRDALQNNGYRLVASVLGLHGLSEYLQTPCTEQDLERARRFVALEHVSWPARFVYDSSHPLSPEPHIDNLGEFPPVGHAHRVPLLVTHVYHLRYEGSGLTWGEE